MIRWRHRQWYSSGQPGEIAAAALWGSHYALRWQEQLFPPFCTTFNLFLFHVYIFSFHMPERKTYKCQGTTETAITAVCARVWTGPPPPPPFAENMKITPFVTHNMLPLHAPRWDTWAPFSTGVSHITLNEQRSWYLPAVAQACHAECSVTVCTVNWLGTNSEPSFSLLYVVAFDGARKQM